MAQGHGLRPQRGRVKVVQGGFGLRQRACAHQGQDSRLPQPDAVREPAQRFPRQIMRQECLALIQHEPDRCFRLRLGRRKIARLW